MLVARTDSYAYRPESQATVSVRALDYVGASQPNVRVERVRSSGSTYDQGRWDEASRHAPSRTAS